MGEMPVLSGMLFCSDCGQKLYQIRGRDFAYDKYRFVCSTYKKIKGGCRSHTIFNVAIEKILLDSIRQITSYAREHESEFVEMVANKSQAELNKNQRDNRRELEQAKKQMRKIPHSGKSGEETFFCQTVNQFPDPTQKAVKHEFHKVLCYYHPSHHTVVFGRYAVQESYSLAFRFNLLKSQHKVFHPTMTSIISLPYFSNTLSKGT